MNAPASWAAAVARQWAALYTAGLPTGDGQRRRAEIESDLWEQQRFESAAGWSGAAISLHIAWRVLCGLPADLAWRAEQVQPVGGSKLVLEGSGNVIVALKTNGWTGLAVLMMLAAVIVWTVLAVYSAAGQHISSTAEDVALVAAILAGVALIAAAGHSLVRSRRQTAAVLALGGLAILALTYWFSPTTW